MACTLIVVVNINPSQLTLISENHKLQPQPPYLPIYKKKKKKKKKFSAPSMASPWHTHLFDCFENPQNALITLLFPCVTFGHIAEILDNGTTSGVRSGIKYSLYGRCTGMACRYRGKLRAKFDLAAQPAPDWVVHCFCHPCALSQEYRELQLRGFDPSIGYAGNVAKQQQIGMTPPMQQRMM